MSATRHSQSRTNSTAHPAGARFPSSGPGTTGSLGPTRLEGWDTARVKGLQFAGKVTVKGGAFTVKTEKKKAPGANGATSTHYGTEVTDLTISVLMWTDDQLAADARIAAELLCVARLKPAENSVGIDAPALSGMGLDTWSVKAVHSLALGPQRGTWVREYVFAHWTAPRKDGGGKVATPTRAIKNAPREAAERKNPSNPLPSSDPTIAGPR